MSPPTPRIIKVIGIGAGSPGHLTQEAIAALRAVDVFLVADKGSAKDDLVAVRRAICAEFIEGVEGQDYRFVTVPDPTRGPDAERDDTAYRSGVADWHAARADRYAEVIAAQPHLTPAQRARLDALHLDPAAIEL